MDKEIAYSFIYSLTDPFTNEVRYIGQTANLEIRFYSHCNDDYSTEKRDWINSLTAKNKLPIMDIIEKCPTLFVSAREAFHIVNHIKKGSKLFNKHYTNELMTSMYHFEMRLDLRGLVKFDCINSKTTDIFLLNDIIAFYYKEKFGYDITKNINDFIGVKSIDTK